jgi:hypothetical protein
MEFLVELLVQIFGDLFLGAMVGVCDAPGAAAGRLHPLRVAVRLAEC